jgi:hypothetical protein
VLPLGIPDTWLANIPNLDGWLRAKASRASGPVAERVRADLFLSGGSVFRGGVRFLTGGFRPVFLTMRAGLISHRMQ